MGAGKGKQDFNWKKFKEKLRDVETEVAKLKTKNDELDGLMVSMYEIFKSKDAMAFYRSLAGHIDNNNKWYEKMHNFNQTNINAKIVRR